MMAVVTDPARTVPSPRELVDLAEAVGREAADLLLAGLDRQRGLVETKTTGTDMVTDMDRAAEQQIVDRIRGARPDDAVVGEEGTAQSGSSGVEWIVDPIDGTTNYLYGYPGFAVSIAVAVHGDIVAAVVVDVMHDDVFTAIRRGGATRNGRPINVAEQPRLEHALVATGFSYQADRRRRQAEVLVRVLPSVRDIRRMGAAAVDLCSVACGRVDAFYERGLARWDFAAGALIATEAGARVGDLDGGAPTTDFVLAASPGVFDALRRLLSESGADLA
jgi:myo-inositol-1(or 4)-monophosphatase